MWEPFTTEQLKALYPSDEDYVARASPGSDAPLEHLQKMLTMGSLPV